MKKKLALMLAAVMLAGSLSGCGKTETAATEATATTDSKPVAETGSQDSQPTDASATEPDKYGGSVTLCHPTEPVTFFLPFSASTGDRASAAPALESLGRSDEEGNIQGWLAESIVSDYEALTCTVKIKEGIKFSDDSDFNAQALIWNFDKMVEGGKESELGSPLSYEATDDYTVVLKYEAWANNWEKILSDVYVYSQAAFDANGEEWAAINPVGTGPFVISQYLQGSGITYTRNENYWIEGQPYLDELKITWISDPTAQMSAFMNKEIDLLAPSESTVIATLGSQFTNIAKESPDLASIKYAMFASGDDTSPFYDINVRMAVMHAIDWEGYAYSLTNGSGVAITQFGVPGAWSYDESREFISYDVELAKKMLTEAGYPEGFATTITTIAANNNIAVLLQASLEAIGIKAEIKTLESADFNAQKKEGVYDGGIITGQGASKMDFASNYTRLYSSKGINYLNMMAHPADYEEALFGAVAAATSDEKKSLLKTASVKLVEEHALLVPLAAIFPVCYVQEDIKDTGMYLVNGDQWTPEALYREK